MRQAVGDDGFELGPVERHQLVERRRLGTRIVVGQDAPGVARDHRRGRGIVRGILLRQHTADEREPVGAIAGVRQIGREQFGLKREILG